MKSNCCLSTLITRSSDEGTSYYECKACGRCEGVFGYNDSVEILLPWSFPLSMIHKKWNPKNYDKALKKYDRYLSERKEEE